MKYFISAGDHSADLHGAALVREIKKLDPEAEFHGMGGPLLAGEGVQILFDPTRHSTIGLLEAAGQYFRFRRLLRVFTRFLAENRPDVLLWIDFGGFNLALAEQARKLSIPVVCLFAPSAWAYGKKRAVRMGKCVSHLVSVMGFEADFYRGFGLKVSYTGHPLIDRVKGVLPREKWRKARGIGDEESVVVLMPGSRRQEVESLLPVMLAAAKKLIEEDPEAAKKIRFFLPLAPTIEKWRLNALLADFPGEITVENEGVYSLLAAADLGVITSGTATLEAVLLGLPAVVVYRLSPITVFIFRRWLRNKEEKDRELLVALPNLIAGRKIIPELLQEDLTAENLKNTMAKLLGDEKARAEIKAEYAKIRAQLGPPGVMARIARIVVAEAQARPELGIES
ncbi:MAG: lipid-A-disaccharide synthase [Firmicutes bacterium]|nr:lipid-A-disaccharide synthase [Bacillota bacterium]